MGLNHPRSRSVKGNSRVNFVKNRYGVLTHPPGLPTISRLTTGLGKSQPVVYFQGLIKAYGNSKSVGTQTAQYKERKK